MRSQLFNEVLCSAPSYVLSNSEQNPLFIAHFETNFMYISLTIGRRTKRTLISTPRGQETSLGQPGIKFHLMVSNYTKPEVELFGLCEVSALQRGTLQCSRLSFEQFRAKSPIIAHFETIFMYISLNIGRRAKRTLISTRRGQETSLGQPGIKFHLMVSNYTKPEV